VFPDSPDLTKFPAGSGSLIQAEATMQRSDYDFDVITGPSTPLPAPEPARPAEPAQPKEAARPQGQPTHG
jgi:hypothetical protein